MSSIVIHVSGDLHLHVGDQERLDDLLAKLNAISVQIDIQGETVMASVAELEAELVKANVATSEIAADLQDLIDSLGDSIPAETLARVQAHVASLEALAATHTPEAPTA